jgi:hypothetical protein
MLTYEEQLDRDFNWGLLEGSLYFEQKSAVHTTMRRFAQRLDQLAIEYAIAGDLCMFFHGYRRFTEIVEVLVTADGLATIHRGFVDDGYVRLPGTEKSIRDIENAGRVRFLISGSSAPQDGICPILIPHPSEVLKIIEGIPIIDVAPLIELKFALGDASHRIRHIADIQELIRYLVLPLDFADLLSPHRRQRFETLWAEAQIAAAEDY